MNGLTIVDTDILIDAAHQTFISKNQRDYRFISGLQLLPYPGVTP